MPNSKAVDTARIMAAIDAQELVELTRNLVRIPSVYRPDEPGANEEAAAQYVHEYLRGRGWLTVTKEEVAPGRPNVTAVLDSGRPGPTLLFEAHTDVVTEGDASRWTYAPFAGEVAGGRIYGRGACDTKGNLAAAVVAVRAMVDSGQFRRGRIVLCIPVDEEGMMTGIKHFIEAGHADGVDAAIICEPEENQICIAQKGAMRVEVRVYGKMAHGAMPLAGINPIPRLADIVHAVRKLERAEQERFGCHPYLGWPSLTPTIIQAPVSGAPQINVMPGEAYLGLDIRTVPGQDFDTLGAQLQETLDRLRAGDPDFRADMSVIERRPWTETGADEPIVRACADAYRVVSGGKEPVYNGVPGATDGTFLWAWRHIPIVTTGAGGRTVPHQHDEYVAIDELVETAKLYAVAATLYLEAN
jgi:succinyl-diaminopimelate desuccinylase